MTQSQIRSRNVGAKRREIRTRVVKSPNRDEWLKALRRHGAVVQTAGEGGDPPCLRSWIDCQGSQILIETCCNGMTPEECVAAHQAEIAAAEERCGSA